MHLIYVDKTLLIDLEPLDIPPILELLFWYSVGSCFIGLCQLYWNTIPHTRLNAQVECCMSKKCYIPHRNAFKLSLSPIPLQPTDILCRNIRIIPIIIKIIIV